ncbi:hypothetical protein BJ546DRAFT_852521 [Cryomyces antarcticus]
MRLRLSIHRHSLPAVKILWNTGDGKTPSTTVAQFLEQVNEIVPLEAEQWGFEDYVVEITGYECLHFQKLENVCRDEDAVSIRPLQTSEVRARTLSGRYQISSDGKHLIDGIAFGRPYLRRPDRPRVRIPPRDRRRVTHSNDDEEEVQFEDGRVNGGLEAEEDDEDFVPGGSNAKRRAIATTNGGGRPRTRSAEQSMSNGRQGSELLSLASDEEDEIDENFGIECDSNSSTSDSSEHSTDEMNEVRSEEDKEIANVSSDLDSSDDTSSSDRSNDLSSSDAPVQVETASGTESTGSSDTEWQNPSAVSSRPKTVQPLVPPHHGKTATKSRNQRRKAAKKLNYFKKLNVLPPDATLEDLKKFSQPEEEIADSDAHLGRTEKFNPEVDFEARRQALLAAIASGGLDITRNRPDVIRNGAMDDNVMDIAVSMPAAGGSNDATVNDVQNEGSERETAVNEPLLGRTDENEARKKRRMKLDVAGSRRLLFGSLGLRTPKTHEDAEKLRSKLMEQAKSKKNPTTTATTTDTAVSVTGADTLEEDAEGDLDAWKGKVKLTAVECCDDHVQLSTPPFPFYQRWDPQQQNYPRGPSGKKRKRNSKKYYQGGQAETYEPYEPEYDEDEHVTLNYDDYGDEKLPGADAEEMFDDDEHDEDKKVDDQLMQEIDSAAAHETDDMPSLPEDMSKLPALQAADVKVGSVIAFKQLEVSAATQWSPKISDYRTARIENMSEPTSELYLTLARRDRPQKEVDEEGNRVYKKFEMAGYESEEAEDYGVIAVQLHDLVEPKLVAAADRDGGSTETLAAEDVVVRDEHSDEVGGSEGAVEESAGAEHRLDNFGKQEDLAEEAKADVTLGADEEDEPSGFTQPMSTALETHREDLQRVGMNA